MTYQCKKTGLKYVSLGTTKTGMTTLRPLNHNGKVLTVFFLHGFELIEST